MIIDFIIEDLMLNSYLQKNFHTLVAAVGAMLIQLKFQSDKLEVVMLSLAKMLDEYNNLYLTHLLLHTQYTRQNLHS